ncbi:MAG: hypothetical protein QOI66_4847 [Myxococcales bacterium]|nr:hypothetical protein [Myxococcales bacterium]
MTISWPRGRARTVTAWTLLAAVGSGVAMLAAAMAVYPGGTALEPGAVGHSFWRNFLCDLTQNVAVNGSPNHPGAGLACGALAAFGVAVGCFWWLLPAVLEGRCNSRWALAIRVLGAVSLLGLVAVPVVNGPAHMVAVFASSVPGLAAAVLAMVACARAGVWPLVVLAVATVGAATIDSVLYAHSYMIHPRVVGPALPAFQRLALMALLVWMVATAVRAGVSAGGRRS